jgi:hypothetical protein
MAGRQSSRPSFDRIADLAWETFRHASRVSSLLMDVYSLRGDNVPDAKKIELARLMLSASVAERMRRLLAGIQELNEKLALELKPDDEAWLRRQLDGLGEKGGA